MTRGAQPELFDGTDGQPAALRPAKRQHGAVCGGSGPTAGHPASSAPDRDACCCLDGLGIPILPVNVGMVPCFDTETPAVRLVRWLHRIRPQVHRLLVPLMPFGR